MNEKKIPASYIAGAIQSRSYKAMQRHLEDVLVVYKLSANEWKVLGLIVETPHTTISHICITLDVELPYITDVVNKLVIREYIKKINSKEDKRSKLLVLTPRALNILPLVEEDVRKRMRELLFGITPDELKIYLKILNLIILNDKNITNSVV